MSPIPARDTATDQGTFAGVGGSTLVERCQACGSPDLAWIVFLGYLPPVNTMTPIGARTEQPAYPTEVLHCRACELVQLGLIVDPVVIFSPDYAYTSGTTKILRDNFAELYREVLDLCPIGTDDLVVDVGSGDGTLLGNFLRGGVRVCGVEPTNASKIAVAAGIPTLNTFFSPDCARELLRRHGRARIVTAANVFAHIGDVHAVLESVDELLTDDGLFVSESHYLVSLIDTLQYDAIYHEHLRYYSLTSLRHLLAHHGFEIVHVKRIPTHGGSIRVYAARKGVRPVTSAVGEFLALERAALTSEAFAFYLFKIPLSILFLFALRRDVRKAGARVYGVGAPSRASSLINYVGIDELMVDCVVEISGSHKIGKYMPGTVIPVLDEQKLFDDQPEYALLLSWHIGEELAAKLRQMGYRGQFIVPLPTPRIL